MALLCRRVWGVTFLPSRDGQRWAAAGRGGDAAFDGVVAEAPSGPGGNSGWSGWFPRSLSQAA